MEKAMNKTYLHDRFYNINISQHKLLILAASFKFAVAKS